MINPVLTNNNLNYNYTKPVFKASEPNKQNKDNKPPNIEKYIIRYSKYGLGIGAFSSFYLLLGGDSATLKLIFKKLGLGILLGGLTGLAASIAADNGAKNKDKKNFYDKLTSGIVVTGLGAIIGSTFLSFTAGDFAVHNWFKGKKTELWGGIAGGLAGALLSIMSSNKNNNKSQPINTQA